MSCSLRVESLDSRNLSLAISPGAASLSFEEAVLPHMDAAYKLALWLTKNEQDAQDVVQEAYLRALKFFSGFHGSDSRPWLLTIVRNTCYTWLKRNRPSEAELDEAVHLEATDTPDPEKILVLNSEKRAVREALETLPLEFREVLIMRELEELSYREIAATAAIPVGTVMSRLARARKKLQAVMVTPTPISGPSVDLRCRP
jgi:RNA polymerase sigma factor (sigma-70 family)